MPVDRDHYRRLAGSFPTGVTIVTARAAGGAPRGLTTQSFVGLSSDPPLVLISIDRTARTLQALRDAPGFVVNFVKSGAEEVASVFASKADDKFAGVAWRPSGVAGGAPILSEVAMAYAECVTERAIEAGDHWIFIGRVEGGEVQQGVPLIYYRRTFTAWPDERPAPEVG